MWDRFPCEGKSLKWQSTLEWIMYWAFSLKAEFCLCLIDLHWKRHGRKLNRDQLQKRRSAWNISVHPVICFPLWACSNTVRHTDLSVVLKPQRRSTKRASLRCSSHSRPIPILTFCVLTQALPYSREAQESFMNIDERSLVILVNQFRRPIFCVSGLPEPFELVQGAEMQAQGVSTRGNGEHPWWILLRWSFP